MGPNYSNTNFFLYFLDIFSWIWPECFITDSLINDIRDSSTIAFIYYFFALYFSALLASIAYFNLSRLNREVKARFLLDIDKRWGEPQIIEAREKIHEFYLECRDPSGQKNKETEKNEISNKILELSRNKCNCAIKSYIKILNFLDFMESIGYLYVSEDITIDN
jgi:hypothetical protein